MVAAGVNLFLTRWPHLRSCRILLIILSPICLRSSPACFPAWFPKFGIGALSMVAGSLCETYSTILQKAMNKNLSTFCWYLSIISTQRYTQFFFLTCTHTQYFMTPFAYRVQRSTKFPDRSPFDRSRHLRRMFLF